MNRSTNRHLGRQPPLRGRLAAIASPKLRTRYSQAATYAQLLKPTFRSPNYQATEDNNPDKSEEIIDVTPPIPKLDTLVPIPQESEQVKQVGQVGQAEKRLIGFIIFWLILLAIGS
ncbi:MAG: hypothetical protein AAFY16_15140 [Cyanobacteria bacterium J06642_3]